MLQPQPHLRDYIQVALRRRWIILTFFTVLVVTVLIGSLKQTPIYQATAVLMIERRSPRVISVQEVAPMGTSDYYAYKDYYETQYKLIRSKTLLKRVADKLGLKSDIPHKEDDTVNRLAKVVKVEPVKNSQLVHIVAESPRPDMAAKIANTVAIEYIGQNLERNINASGDAAKWLAEKIGEQRNKLKVAESALQAYREKHDINVLPQITGGAAVEDVKAEYARLQAQLANYSHRYTDEHPRMIELRAQIGSLKNKVQGLQDASMGDNAMEYRVLEEDVQTIKRMYEALLTRYKEIDLSGELTVNNISIIDRAGVPTKPIRPNVKLNLILAVMVGLVGGAGLGFFVDYLDTTIKSPQDITNILGVNFLGAIPEMEEKDELRRDQVVRLDSRSVVSEAYRAIRTEILHLLSQAGDLKAILVTSSEPQAGKTMTLVNLGIALAQKGSQVVVVDTDLRKPQLHRIFSLDRHSGVSEYLSGETGLESITKDTGIENLKVVTSGNSSGNPAEILSSRKAEALIKGLKDRFDFVLFDSPPVMNVADGIILADKVDALVQVVRSGKTLVQIVLRTKERLINTKAKYLGAVLNALKVYHGDYYYRYYHYAYGDDKGRRAPKDSPAQEELIVQGT